MMTILSNLGSFATETKSVGFGPQAIEAIDAKINHLKTNPETRDAFANPLHPANKQTLATYNRLLEEKVSMQKGGSRV